MKRLYRLLVKDPLIILLTVAMGSLSLLVSLADRQNRATDRIARWWARMLLAVAGVRVRVSGAEKIPRDGRFVFAGNHRSLIDTPVVLAHVPVRFLFLVNAKYVRIPFLGTHLRRTGHFSVEPDDVRASMRAMTEAARAVRERDVSILLFPEGSRSPGPMEPFKDGAAYIAIKAGVPVIPFALRGTREVLPIGSIEVRGGPVDLVFGEPIPTEGYRLTDRARLTQVIFERVSELLARAERASDSERAASRVA
jgi:1-acyl-sn-glycerol-3-phosphate acyltransferase